MSLFDPCSFISPHSTESINKCSYFGFHFVSRYAPEIWPEFNNNFFVSPLAKILSCSGSLSSVVVGCVGEIISPTTFIITDLNLTSILCSTSFSIEFLNAGTLVMLNCPMMIQRPDVHFKLNENKQLFVIGGVPGFAICERFGHHHSCSKYIDKSQRRLCHFHTKYYKLKLMAIQKIPFTASELQAPKIIGARKSGGNYLSSMSKPVSSYSYSLKSD